MSTILDRGTTAEWLRRQGWQMLTPYDTCWLDCPEQGYLREWQGKRICLCLPHASVLERGTYNGDYRGAPLPPATLAGDWPWDVVAAALCRGAARDAGR